MQRREQCALCGSAAVWEHTDSWVTAQVSTLLLPAFESDLSPDLFLEEQCSGEHFYVMRPQCLRWGGVVDGGR